MPTVPFAYCSFCRMAMSVGLTAAAGFVHEPRAVLQVGLPRDDEPAAPLADPFAEPRVARAQGEPDAVADAIREGAKAEH